MRRTKARLGLGVGRVLPGPHKSFIRLRGGFPKLCGGIRSGLRCSRETSPSLPRLCLSEVSRACNTAVGYKPKGAGTALCTAAHTNTTPDVPKKKKKTQKTPHNTHTHAHARTGGVETLHTRAPQHAPLLLSPLRFIYNPLAAVQGPGAITHGT